MKTVLITGSEGQLGSTYISRLLNLGHNVIGFDIVPQTKHKKIIYSKVDITKPQQIENALENLKSNTTIDVLVNNAGVAVFTPFEERTEEDLDYVINVNLKGTIFMTQVVFNKFFKPQKKGCIVNIGSLYGVVSSDMGIYREDDRRSPEIYAATKAAVIQLTRYFAAYMAPYNVRVNCISPGGIFNHQDSEFVRKYSQKVPMGRMGDEKELLTTLEYLISDNSSYVTGQNILIDGGFSAW